jgi:hypothetical protein
LFWSATAAITSDTVKTTLKYSQSSNSAVRCSTRAARASD